MGLLPYLKEIFTTGEVGVSKHQPDIYHLAAEQLDTRPAETLVFEDSLYALKTAAAAGYRTVGVFDASGGGRSGRAERGGGRLSHGSDGLSRLLESSESNKGTDRLWPVFRRHIGGHHLVSPYKTVL